MHRPYCACVATGARWAIACAMIPVTLFFGAVVLLIVLMAIFAPLLAPFDPYKESVILRLKPSGYRGHPFGTDELGRDLLSRLIYGGRSSLLMGLIPVCDRHHPRRHTGRDRRFRRSARQRGDHAHNGRVLRVSLRAAGGGDLRRDGWRHGERHGRAGAGVHSRNVSCRGNRDRTGAQPGLHRGRTRNRCGHAHHRALPCTRQRARARLHLCLEPGVGQHPAGVGPVFPGPWREAADTRLGSDAQHAARSRSISCRCPARCPVWRSSSPRSVSTW